MFGAYAQASGTDTFGEATDAITTLERNIGRKLALDNLYATWGNPLPIRVASWDLSQGTIPMISWGWVNTNSIAAGAYDRQIRAAALQLRGLHRTVMLRWFYEMDGVKASSYVSSPASFIAAWRHMHNIFVQAGATNVSWVWCPNAFNFAGGVSQRYYPGGAYVNWVCADGYNWAPQRKGSRWNSFANIFSAFYNWGITTGKPLMVGEFGVLEAGGDKKAAWLMQAADELRTRFPAIRAVDYFDALHQGFDWRVTTSSSALDAFRTFADEPYFGAQPSL